MLELITNPNLTAANLLAALKIIPILRESYEQKVRHYVLEKHTLLVINEFDKYFSNAAIPIGKALFRLLLALHDVGKPRAAREGDINKQYLYTIEIINQVRNSLPVASKEITNCIAIISDDPIGLYLQNKISLPNAKGKIQAMSQKSTLDIERFFKTLSIYYQCDIASYTADAGGLRYLEHIFVYTNGNKMFDKAAGLLKFSANFEKKYNELKKEVI